jgi:hypothetical protein
LFAFWASAGTAQNSDAPRTKLHAIRAFVIAAPFGKEQSKIGSVVEVMFFSSEFKVFSIVVCRLAGK